MGGYSLVAFAAFLSATVVASNGEAIDDILKSLDNGIVFFENRFRHINLDGVAGYTILHAKLKAAVRVWEDTELAGDPKVAAAAALTERLDRVLPLAYQTLQETEPKYFREFEPLMDAGFWTIPRKWSSTDPSLAYSAFRATECYNERLSDKCITLLLGTWKDNGTPCIVTESCRDTMTVFGCPYYSLSHQLLYFMIGKMRGCSNILQGEKRQTRANLTDEYYQEIFCSNMMKTNQEIARKNFSGHTRDIFIENIMLCGVTGFSDFYNSDWLRHILLWQDPGMGCFGKDEEQISQALSRDLLEALQQHKRVKRREKMLGDGCSSHMTGVAVSALGGYLNYYLTEQDSTKTPVL
ncbi:UPF0764 protein C16orf89 homolog [Paramormyrops kingsleyae]|uniref:Chromosome 16 open reading frame 89 n=1 Tax=Paramormyrops kingsleyae TaxID=1676925 RepID=A0A3B3Q6L8_9TELE|nr:UPF0764 protein C16orf89 homolog [Paramormyrops kingsleyae]